MTEDEARFTLFAFRHIIDEEIESKTELLTPGMRQFYESQIKSLGEKLRRLDSGSGEPPERYSYAKVRPTWGELGLH